MENKPGFRFGFVTILFIIVMAGQYVSTSYLQDRFNARLQESYEAINQSTMLLTALINKLEEKKVLTRNEILAEAQIISGDLRALMQKIEDEKNKTAEPKPLDGR